MHRVDRIRIEAEVAEAGRRVSSALRLLEQAQQTAEPHRTERIRQARLELAVVTSCHRRAVAVLA